jgi:hypothetical protein
VRHCANQRGDGECAEGGRRLTDWNDRDSVDGGILEGMEIFEGVDVGESGKGRRRVFSLVFGHGQAMNGVRISNPHSPQTIAFR